jgi:hypothetical protein
MEIPERATDSGTTTTTQKAGNEGHRPLTERSFKGRSMKYRTLGRTAIEDGDVPLGDERQTGL